MKTFEKTFEVSLSEHEQNEIGKELAEKRIQMQTLSSKKDEINKAYKKQIDGLDIEVLAKSRMIQSGKAPKKINCYVQADDPTTGKKTFYRADNNEVIETQDMTAEEIGDPSQLNVFNTDTTEEDKPLNYFLNIFGIDVNEINFEDKEAFVANNPSDLEDHDIPIGEIEKVKGCLLIKCSHEAIKEILSVKYKHKLRTDRKAISWYIFPPINIEDQSYEVVESEEETEEAAN